MGKSMRLAVAAPSALWRADGQTAVACAPIQKRRFYPELESLRGVAAMIVVGYHASEYFGAPSIQSLEGVRQIFVLALFPGSSAVALFFVLSGFVLAQTIPSDPIAAVNSYPAYVIRRLFRLLPAMWFAIGAAASVALYVGRAVDWRAAAWALVFADSQIDPPLWTLRVEFYLSIFLLPTLAIISSRVGMVGNLLIHATLVAYFMPRWDGLASYAFMFHLGCLVPTIGKAIFDRLTGLAEKTVISISVFILCCASPIIDINKEMLPYVSVAMAPPCFLIISYFVHRDCGPLLRLMRSAPFRHLGRISYSVYLLHWSVMVASESFFFSHIPMLPAPVMEGTFVGCIMLLTTAVATIAYYGVERPFIALGQRVTKRRPQARRLIIPNRLRVVASA
jgi:peptidoglycan/LPS O-acetylase OafA/YrhL